MSSLRQIIFGTHFQLCGQTFVYTRGVPQGSQLSPALCDIFYGFIIKKITWTCLVQTKMNITIYRYVDDLLIMSDNKGVLDTFLAMVERQIRLKTSSSWCGFDPVRQIAILEYSGSMGRGVDAKYVAKIQQISRKIKLSATLGCNFTNYVQQIKTGITLWKRIIRDGGRQLQVKVLNALLDCMHYGAKIFGITVF